MDKCGIWSPVKDPNMPQGESTHWGVVYAVNGKQYWIVGNEDKWIPTSENGVKRFLNVEAMVSNDRIGGYMNFITCAANVEFATSLAGYRRGIYQFDGRRILVTTSPRIIEPKQGDCTTP